MDSKILKALGIDPALIFLFLLVLIVILFVLYVNVTMKYNRLKSSYTTFMRGKDGKTLEESMMHLMKWVVNSVSHLQCWTIIILVGSSMRCTAEKAAILM